MLANENQVDVDMFSDMSLGTEVQSTIPTETKPRLAPIAKLLHPPSAISNYKGLPTNDARSQVNIEWRNISVNKSPIITDFGGSTTIGYNNSLLRGGFDYAILVPNGARVLGIPFVTNYTTDNNFLTQDLNNVMLQENYNFANWTADASVYRPAYKSITTYLNATAFNDVGLVVSCQFNPAILYTGTLLQMVHKDPDLFYTFIHNGLEQGFIRHSKNPTRLEQENWELLPHYVRSELIRKHDLDPSGAISADVNLSIQIIDLSATLPQAGFNKTGPGILPTTSGILSASARSYGGKAKEGCFAVSRLNTLTPRWTNAGVAGSATANTGLVDCYFATARTITTGAPATYIGPFFSNTPAGTSVGNIPALKDTLWTSDMTWSWVYYSGLMFNSSPGSQVNIQNNLVISKYYTGYEVQPSFASAWTGMQVISPKPDIEAMQATMDAFYELKDAMPARYNFWGTVGSLALKGLKTFGAGMLRELVTHVGKSLAGKVEGKDETSEGSNDKPAGTKKNKSRGARRRNGNNTQPRATTETTTVTVNENNKNNKRGKGKGQSVKTTVKTHGPKQ